MKAESFFLFQSKNSQNGKKLMKRKRQFPLIIFLICLSLFATYCTSTKSTQPKSDKETQYNYQNKDLDELRDLWLVTKQYKEREKILKEMEQRKSFEGLRYCYDLTGWVVTTRKYRKEDRLFIVQAFGRLKINKAVPILTELLDDNEYVLRTQALDSLGKIKDPRSVDSILPLLFDSHPGIRGKAIYTLGEIGDSKAIGRISMFLADKDPFVRDLSETSLKKLGVSEEKIQDWKIKAQSLSLDDVYKAKISCEKAITEKEELQARLNTETDIKRQLEKSLKERDLALKRKEDLVETLYENERELKSKQAQLDITRQQFEEYQAELQRLNAKVQSLNAELNKSKTQAATENVKEALDKTLEAKLKLEQETKNSREKETMLREEILNLNALAEKTRLEAEDAKQEFVNLRNREKQLAAQVNELKQRLDRSMAPVLVVSKPIDGLKIESPNTLLHFIAVDDKGISKIDVSLNGNPVKLEDRRGLEIVATDGKFSKKIDIVEGERFLFSQSGGYQIKN
jgi:HEAT repeat protein